MENVQKNTFINQNLITLLKCLKLNGSWRRSIIHVWQNSMNSLPFPKRLSVRHLPEHHLAVHHVIVRQLLKKLTVQSDVMIEQLTANGRPPTLVKFEELDARIKATLPPHEPEQISRDVED